MRDLALARRIESALAGSEARSQVIFDSSPVALLLATFDGSGVGRVLKGNRALCRLTGYSETALRGLEPGALVQAGGEAAPISWDLVGYRGDAAVDFCRVQRWTHADGHSIGVRASFNAVRNDDGQAQYVVGCIEDVTFRLRADASLRHSEEALRRSLEHAAAVITAVQRARADSALSHPE